MFFKKPWDNRKSIFQSITDNPGVRNIELPDDEKYTLASGIKWAPGAMDGVLGHHSSCKEEAKELAVIFKNISIKGKVNDKVSFYKIVEKDSALSIIDDFIQEVINLETPITAHMYDWIEFLILKSPDRGAVKIGIAIAGSANMKDLMDPIRVIGRHDEFTLYSTVALSNLSDNPDNELFNLAKEVDGWGRIQLVERLENTKNKEIKKWILLEGYKNSIMYEYLALIAAQTGELSSELKQDKVDKEVLRAAADIIQALISEGPVSGISEYKDAAEVFTLFVDKTNNIEKELMYLVTYKDIFDYLNDDFQIDEQKSQQGWTNEIVIHLKKQIQLSIDNIEWKKKLESEIDTKDNVTFWNVKQAAKIIKYDLTQVFWNRLKEDSLNTGKWYDLISNFGDEYNEDILNFARQILPLKEMCTGAQNQTGIGNEFVRYTILLYILQYLIGKKGLGIDFVLSGLFSPVINNRNMSLSVIESWEREQIDEVINKKLLEALDNETQENIKERINNIILNI